MNWIFGGSKNSNLPETTPLQAQKAKQIDQLRKFNQNVTEVRRDSEYRVGFLINGASYSLIINLPNQFPKDRPNVTVSPAVSHPWVNDRSDVTGCPGLNNFSMHSDLGSIIRQIVDEFNRNPPQPKQFPQYPYPGANPSLAAYMDPHRYAPYPQPKHNYITQPAVAMPTLPPRQQTPTGSTASSSGNQPVIPQPSLQAYSSEQTIGGYQMPEIPTVFPQLRDMSISDLKELEDNEDRLLELIRKLPEVEQIAKDRQSMQGKNEQIARENLSKKPVLEEKKNHLLERFDILNELRRNFDQQSHRQDELRQQFHPEVIRDNLKVAALQADEESEAIADNFLDGKITADEFRTKFMQKRTLSHLRKAKEEKLGTLVADGRTLVY